MVGVPTKRAKTSKNKEKEDKIAKISEFLVKAGLAVLIIGVALFFLVFYPVLFQELKYLVNRPDANIEVFVEKQGDLKDFDPRLVETGKTVIEPVDPNFSIIVPKISANARVIANVDPYNSKVYQRELTKGVAHAAGTAFPDQKGNTFLFAHSSDNFYNANRYNAVFYLLNKMEIGDDFLIVYEKEKYTYRVVEDKLVPPEAVEYLAAPLGDPDKQTVTLMTCWPPGTTINRLVVVGELINKE